MLHSRLDLLFSHIAAIVEPLHGNAAPDPGGRENSLGVIVGESDLFSQLLRGLRMP